MPISDTKLFRKRPTSAMKEDEKRSPPASEITRREFVETAVLVGGAAVTIPIAAGAQTTPYGVPTVLIINGQRHQLNLDPRVTLLDLLREDLHLTGTKKGCDHGQCGACTVLSNGRRINSCLSLAVAHDGESITTIEGLSTGGALHPLQAAFLDHDGFQCGFCTPGQIRSAKAALHEARTAST